PPDRPAVALRWAVRSAALFLRVAAVEIGGEVYARLRLPRADRLERRLLALRAPRDAGGHTLRYAGPRRFGCVGRIHDAAGDAVALPERAGGPGALRQPRPPRRPSAGAGRSGRVLRGQCDEQERPASL